ncbi:hypothetical protein SNE40_016947 [Patella caerulea]|uniref:Uncharacterized protein n=1 Tax=Patella caerulea TaxID=87958 RepID=A0AAN8JE70_PATCE
MEKQERLKKERLEEERRQKDEERLEKEKQERWEEEGPATETTKQGGTTPTLCERARHLLREEVCPYFRQGEGNEPEKSLLN